MLWDVGRQSKSFNRSLVRTRAIIKADKLLIFESVRTRFRRRHNDDLKKKRGGDCSTTTTASPFDVTLIFTTHFSILTAASETFQLQFVIFDSPAHGGNIHRKRSKSLPYILCYYRGTQQRILRTSRPILFPDVVDAPQYSQCERVFQKYISTNGDDWKRLHSDRRLC